MKNFIKKDGDSVLISSFFTKICSFSTSLLLIRILDVDEYGYFTYVLAVLAFFLPFSGGGMQYSYLRFAPKLSEESEKMALFDYSIRRGILYTFLLAVLLFLTVPWLNQTLANTSHLFYVSIFYLFGFFLIELVKMKYRVAGLNKKFAGLDASLSLLVFVLGCGMAYFYGPLAYLIALVGTPLILGIFHVKIPTRVKVKIPKTYHSYGLWVGLGAIASQLMYSLDVFLVGQVIQDPEQVAIYRSASIIPLALFFIPNSYITTYYADLAKHSEERGYLIRFAKDYLKLFFGLSLVGGALLYMLSDHLIFFLFGEAYIEAAPLFEILILGMVGAFLFRIPFGNLLASVGKSNWNAVVALVILILNGVLNYFAIDVWGVAGAAVVTSALLWVSGLVSVLLFSRYLKSLN